MYKPKYFIIEELVSKDEYSQYHSQYGDRLFLLFDYRILITADMLRELFGPIVCNTWHYGGSNHYRGFRPWHVWVGAVMSQHKFGRALDLVPVKLSAEEVRQDIIAHPTREAYQHIKAIEDGVGWLHIDCRNEKEGRPLLRFGGGPVTSGKGDSDESNR